MPRITERVEIEKEPRLGGGGPGKIPYRRGGGDGDGDEGPDDFLSSQERLRRYRIFLIAVLISVFTLFAAIAILYLLRGRATGWDPVANHPRAHARPVVLPYLRMLINTVVLGLSSLTLELARRGMVRKMEFISMGIVPVRWQTEVGWLAATVVLGMGFLAGQITVWLFLRSQGVYISNDLSGSLFFLTTGLHALHLVGGLIALLYALGGSWFRLNLSWQRVVLETTAWYWHFMGILWVGIFAMLHFAN